MRFVQKKSIRLFLVSTVAFAGFFAAAFVDTFLAAALAAETDASPALKIALVHFDPRYKKAEDNRQRLLSLNRQAARQGAKLILNTEMAVTGYSFQSRRDVAPFTETEQDKTLSAMSRLAKEFGVYVGITFPERDPKTQSYYNGAFVLDPQGRLVCKYHKVAAEKRWARPGSAVQDGFFDTPWGRIGVLICADTYYSLMPRAMALRGVDLLWVPANWPPTNGLDPQFIWRARAIENGFFVAACNRTGKDRIMDCREASSYMFDPEGRRLFAGTSETARVFWIDVPLNPDGRLNAAQRRLRLADRSVDHYRPVYLDPWVADLTQFYDLPEPGMIDIHCFIPPSGPLNLTELEERIEDAKSERPALWILPETDAVDIKINGLREIARKHQLAFALSLKKTEGRIDHMLITEEGAETFFDAAAAAENAFPYKILHYGPAAMAMADDKAFLHPEFAVVLSKLGSDLVILSEEIMSPENLLVSRIKSLNGVAVAACTENTAEITSVQGMHGTWDQIHCDRPGVCSYALDTAKTRQKSFQSRIDFDILLSSP